MHMIHSYALVTGMRNACCCSDALFYIMRPPVPHVAAQARRSGGHDLGGGRGLRWLCLLARVPERIQQVRAGQGSQVV